MQNTVTKAPVPTLTPLLTLPDVTTGTLFLGENTLVYGRGKALFFLDISSRRERRVSADSSSLRDIAVTATGNAIATLSEKGQITFWNRSGKPVRRLSLGVKWGSGLALSPDARYLAVAPENKPITVYDAHTGHMLFASRWADRGVFTPDGKNFIAGGGYRLRIWEVATRKMRTEIKTGDAQTLRPFAVSPDGRQVYVLNAQGKPYNYSVQVFSAANLSRVRNFDVASGDISFGWLQGAALSGNGRLLVTLRRNADPPGSMPPFTLWNAETGDTLLNGKGPEWEEAALSPTGRTLAVRRGTTVQLFSLSGI